MGDRSVKSLLQAGNIGNAAITITALPQEIKRDTVKLFFHCWCECLSNSKLLEEFAQVYRATGVMPEWPQIIVFVNLVYKVLKNKTREAKNLRDVVEVCYDLLLKAERPEYFYRFYCTAGLEPSTDMIYQAAMIARIKNELDLKKKICDAFQIVV